MTPLFVFTPVAIAVPAAAESVTSVFAEYVRIIPTSMESIVVSPPLYQR